MVFFFYTGQIDYNINKLPFSESYLLVYLYISSVNRGLSALADAAYSRLRHPQTCIGDLGDIKSVLYLVLYSQVGKKAAGIKRTTEIREAVVEEFALEILIDLAEDDLEHYCRDNAEFRDIMLRALIIEARRMMLQRGLDLDELD